MNEQNTGTHFRPMHATFFILQHFMWKRKEDKTCSFMFLNAEYVWIMFEFISPIFCHCMIFFFDDSKHAHAIIIFKCNTNMLNCASINCKIELQVFHHHEGHLLLPQLIYTIYYIDIYNYCGLIITKCHTGIQKESNSYIIIEWPNPK